MFIRPPYKTHIGFNITFADGHKIHHEGGCATIPDEQIKQHGRVMKAEEF
jgi:hypothetical protein